MLRQQAIILMIVSIFIFLTADLLGENSPSETEEAVRIIITRDNEVLTVDLPAHKIKGELFISEQSLAELLSLFSAAYMHKSDEEKPKIEMISVMSQSEIEYEETILTPEATGVSESRVFFKESPKIIEKVDPQYPDSLKTEGVEGTVLLEVEISATGEVGKVTVLKSLTPELDKEAVKVIRQWKFSPAIDYRGEPVKVQARIPIIFKLEK